MLYKEFAILLCKENYSKDKDFLFWKTPMKTATVTWITYNNYGTLLQAYALQKKIELLGHENAILNDSQILKEYFAAKRKNASPAQHAPAAPRETAADRLKRILGNPGALRRRLLARINPEGYAFPYEGSQSACLAFKKEALTICDDVIPGQLDGLNERYDTFIAGSDQIWSVFDSIFNPYYYLDFAKGKKIAYAPCLGTDKIPEDAVRKIRELLAGFSAISARESVSAKQLSQTTGRDVAWVCDPTLLHDAAFWGAFTAPVQAPKGKYLLCYFLESRPWYFIRAKKLAKGLGLRIKLIPSRWEHLSSEYVIDDAVGPREFVSLFQHAEYVLTDSYHGSIFSMIFEKNFQYLLRFHPDDPASQNIRIQSLFDGLGLQSRIVTEHTNDVQMDMDHRPIQEKLALFRKESMRYLKQSLDQEVNS